MEKTRDNYIWDALYEYANSEGVRVFPKRSSKLMWALYYLGFMWIWNRKFMDRVHTTNYPVIYMPEDRIGVAWQTLAHELVHCKQHKTWGIWKESLYFFPQMFAPLGLLGLLGLVWWPLYFLFLLIPLFLFPIIPAYWRIEKEIPAMGMTVACYHFEYEQDGLTITEGMLPEKMKNLQSSAYFWPGLLLSKSQIANIRERMLNASKDAIRTPIFEAVLNGFLDWQIR